MKVYLLVGMVQDMKANDLMAKNMVKGLIGCQTAASIQVNENKERCQEKVS